MKTLNIGFLTALLIFSVSCRNSDIENKTLSTSAVAININLLKDDFEDVADKNIQASDKHISIIDNNFPQTSKVSLSNEFDLVAELKPEISSLKSTAALNPIAAITAIQRTIKFRVVVYNASGQYNSSYIYSISASGAVTPDSGVAMKLNGGENYTFVAYSYNTNVAPAENLVGTNISTASVVVSPLQDLMYYKVNMTPSGEAGAQNNLDIVLKHKLSSIVLSLDSSLTNYNITNVSGITIGKTYPTATLNFSTGVLTSSGTAGTVNVSFPANPNTNNLTASSVIVNNSTGTNDGSVNISSLTVGPLTGTNLAFNNLTIQTGVKYILKLSLVPVDVYLDYNGQKAVRINGNVWMRHNLGADTSLDENLNPSVPGLHGNYYEFGRKDPVATGTETSLNSNYSGYPPPANSWNTGTEYVPTKTITDPCPSGYRLPTQTEYNALLNATLQSNAGSWFASNTNYSAAKVLTSKRNANVKMSFPAQGSFGVTGNGAPYVWFWTNRRGDAMLYWTSSSSNGINIAYLWGDSTTSAYTAQYIDGNQSDRVLSRNVRCIAQ